MTYSEEKITEKLNRIADEIIEQDKKLLDELSKKWQ